MTSWLRELPHQIPFRAASSARRIDDRTMEGVYLCSADDALTEGAPVETALFEAMAQVAGTLAFDGTSVPGYLSALENAVIASPVAVGDRLELRVTMDAAFAGIFRFHGVALRDGLECATAQFYLAAQSRESGA